MSKSLVRSLACGAGADLERETSSDDNANYEGYNNIKDGTTGIKTVGTLGLRDFNEINLVAWTDLR